ncbi:MAG: hypothetical protein J2P19_01100 [Pseudonocardia sp.]|nr:hypothetical protein [Pseudonocardia sp.]
MSNEVDEVMRGMSHTAMAFVGAIVAVAQDAAKLRAERLRRAAAESEAARRRTLQQMRSEADLQAARWEAARRQGLDWVDAYVSAVAWRAHDPRAERTAREIEDAIRARGWQLPQPAPATNADQQAARWEAARAQGLDWVDAYKSAVEWRDFDPRAERDATAIEDMFRSRGWQPPELAAEVRRDSREAAEAAGWDVDAARHGDPDRSDLVVDEPETTRRDTVDEPEDRRDRDGRGGADELVVLAAEHVLVTQFGDAGALARKLGTDHAQAASLLDALAAHGIVGPSDGPHAREVLVGPDGAAEALARLRGSRPDPQATAGDNAAEPVRLARQSHPQHLAGALAQSRSQRGGRHRRPRQARIGADPSRDSGR